MDSQEIFLQFIINHAFQISDQEPPAELPVVDVALVVLVAAEQQEVDLSPGVGPGFFFKKRINLFFIIIFGKNFPLRENLLTIS